MGPTELIIILILVIIGVAYLIRSGRRTHDQDLQEQMLKEEEKANSDLEMDNLSKIEKLQELKENGAITEKEFEEKKKEIWESESK